MNTITNFRQSLDDFCQFPTTPTPANKTTGNHADIYLFGIIGSKRINAHTVQQAINKAGKPDSFTFHINTIGGSFAEGLAIYNLIKAQAATTTARVSGYALSMGSLLMLAADRVECAANGLIMIHGSQGLTMGDTQEHEQAIAVLRKHDQILINTYRPRLNKTDDDIMKLLQNETWYTASEAKAAGLIDAITGQVEIDQQEAEQGADDVPVGNFRHPPQGFRQSASTRYS